MTDAHGRVDAACDGIDTFGGWEDENALDAAEMSHMIPQVLRSVVVALYHVSKHYEEGPYHPTIAATIHDAITAVVGAEQEAEDVGTQFEKLHEDQLERLRNPRPGSEKWDLTANR